MKICLGLAAVAEEETATHSSILVWRIQRTEEPGGLQYQGWQAQTEEQEKVRDQKNHQRVKTKQSTGPPKNMIMIKYISKILNSL